MIGSGQRVFVDTGAWIAMALVADPYHSRAAEIWGELLARGARLATSVPVALETFTFLDRNAQRDVALAWKDSLRTLRWFKMLSCLASDVEQSWAYFRPLDAARRMSLDHQAPAFNRHRHRITRVTRRRLHR